MCIRDRTYAALTGDLHSHTDWSDGGSPLEEMALTAIELGQSWLAITDHSPRLKVANGLSAARLTQQIARVRGVDAALGGRFRLLTGIEVDILDDGSLDQTSELLGQLDVVTASVHSKLAMASAPMTRRMVAAVENPRVNVLGPVSYTHLDVYKRQPEDRLDDQRGGPQGGCARELSRFVDR